MVKGLSPLGDCPSTTTASGVHLGQPPSGDSPLFYPHHGTVAAWGLSQNHATNGGSGGTVPNQGQSLGHLHPMTDISLLTLIGEPWGFEDLPTGYR